MLHSRLVTSVNQILQRADCGDVGRYVGCTTVGRKLRPIAPDWNMFSWIVYTTNSETSLIYPLRTPIIIRITEDDSQTEFRHVTLNYLRATQRRLRTRNSNITKRQTRDAPELTRWMSKPCHDLSASSSSPPCRLVSESVTIRYHVWPPCLLHARITWCNNWWHTVSMAKCIPRHGTH